MQGLKRKIVYVTLYELIAAALTTAGLAVLFEHSAGHASVVAVAASAIAIAWSFAYNTAFEAWEARQAGAGRSLARRIAHAIGFEAGLVALLVPLLAWWLGVSLWDALVLDLGLIVFFLIYSFAFNWAFDQIFGLPVSALAKVEMPAASCVP